MRFSDWHSAWVFQFVYSAFCNSRCVQYQAPLLAVILHHLWAKLEPETPRSCTNRILIMFCWILWVGSDCLVHCLFMFVSSIFNIPHTYATWQAICKAWLLSCCGHCLLAGSTNNSKLIVSPSSIQLLGLNKREISDVCGMGTFVWTLLKYSERSGSKLWVGFGSCDLCIHHISSQGWTLRGLSCCSCHGKPLEQCSHEAAGCRA